MLFANNKLCNVVIPRKNYRMPLGLWNLCIKSATYLENTIVKKWIKLEQSTFAADTIAVGNSINSLKNAAAWVNLIIVMCEALNSASDSGPVSLCLFLRLWINRRQ